MTVGIAEYRRDSADDYIICRLFGWISCESWNIRNASPSEGRADQWRSRAESSGPELLNMLLPCFNLPALNLQ